MVQSGKNIVTLHAEISYSQAQTKGFFCANGNRNERAPLRNNRLMDNNFKQKIDAIVTELCKVNDLNIKIDILNYMEQQASFLLWQLEDEKHLDENNHNI